MKELEEIVGSMWRVYKEKEKEASRQESYMAAMDQLREEIQKIGQQA